MDAARLVIVEDDAVIAADLGIHLRRRGRVGVGVVQGVGRPGDDLGPQHEGDEAVGGVGVRRIHRNGEAVEPELGVERGDRDRDIRKQFCREGLVANHCAGRCLQDFPVPFLGREVVI